MIIIKTPKSFASTMCRKTIKSCWEEETIAVVVEDTEFASPNNLGKGKANSWISHPLKYTSFHLQPGTCYTCERENSLKKGILETLVEAYSNCRVVGEDKKHIQTLLGTYNLGVCWTIFDKAPLD